MPPAREVNSEIVPPPIDTPRRAFNDARMTEIIYPRSSREAMDGWMHLPRYVDKIRLHLAGKLHSDYHANFGRGFDAMWLKAAGVTHGQMIEIVKNSFIDSQVFDWVRTNVRKSAAEKRAHAEMTLNRPAPEDAAAQERFKLRKQEFKLAQRDDVKTFVDLNDADEKRF
jgi:hypothetical protein